MKEVKFYIKLRQQKLDDLQLDALYGVGFDDSLITENKSGITILVTTDIKEEEALDNVMIDRIIELGNLNIDLNGAIIEEGHGEEQT